MKRAGIRKHGFRAEEVTSEIEIRYLDERVIYRANASLLVAALLPTETEARERGAKADINIVFGPDDPEAVAHLLGLAMYMAVRQHGEQVLTAAMWAAHNLLDAPQNVQHGKPHVFGEPAADVEIDITD